MVRKRKAKTPTRKAQEKSEAITQIAVAGYKSLSSRQAIEIREITVLAGANSSGKSSIMQPLLLLKQTLEAGYDPGPLLLEGPNVRFTSAVQFLSRRNAIEHGSSFAVEMLLSSNRKLDLTFRKVNEQPIAIESLSYSGSSGKLTLRPDMKSSEIRSILPEPFGEMIVTLEKVEKGNLKCVIKRNRCFLDIRFESSRNGGTSLPLGISPLGAHDHQIRGIIHLPGLRGNPERTYPVTAVGPQFPGTFEKYTASVIAQWQANGQEMKLDEVNEDLSRLGLTWKILAKRVTDTQVALEVGRLRGTTERGGHDMVSIADVGFGVSQSLPVVVALHAAQPGQLVFLEQPEIHLHPRAQHALAQIIGRAANRGVRVVVETHSALLLLGLQTLVGTGDLQAGKIALHWFQRAEDGHSYVESAHLDQNGTFGEWPEDFAGVLLDAENQFLSAAERPKKLN